MSGDAVPRELVGFRALGRQGELGVVVGVEGSHADSPELVVLGGVSQSLTYFVPLARVRSVSAEHRAVVLDLDVSDFVPSLREDGTVALRAVPS